MAQTGPAPANTAFLGMETFEPISQEPLSQASCDKAPSPVPELQDPFYAGTTLPQPREFWNLEWRGLHQQFGKGGLWEKSYSLTPSSFFSFLFLLFLGVSLPFSQNGLMLWPHVKGVCDHMSDGKLMERGCMCEREV